MEPTNTNNNSKKGLGIGIAVVAILLIIFVVFANNKNSNQSQTNTPTETPTTTPETPIDTTPQANSSTYKDGTYTATGSYISPGGPDKIAVTLTIKNDIVTDASVTPQPGDNTSKKYQGIFADNYKSYVIGKDITTLNLTKVSGSSLTPKGFDDALAQIKVQAKA